MIRVGEKRSFSRTGTLLEAGGRGNVVCGDLCLTPIGGLQATFDDLSILIVREADRPIVGPGPGRTSDQTGRAAGSVRHLQLGQQLGFFSILVRQTPGA